MTHLTAALADQTTTFGRALREARADLGLTQEGLQERLAARGVEVSINSISAWETDAKRPRVAKIPAIFAALEIEGMTATMVQARFFRGAA